MLLRASEVIAYVGHAYTKVKVGQCCLVAASILKQILRVTGIDERLLQRVDQAKRVSGGRGRPNRSVCAGMVVTVSVSGGRVERILVDHRRNRFYQLELVIQHVTLACGDVKVIVLGHRDQSVNIQACLMTVVVTIVKFVGRTAAA